MHLFPAIKKEKDLLYISKTHRHHIIDVLRYNLSDKVNIIYQDKIYLCKFVSLKSNLVCQIIEKKKISSDQNSFNTTNVFVGLIELRPLKLLVEKLTELNANKIFIVKLKHSNSYLVNKIEQKIETLKKISQNSQIQSNCTSIPEIIFLSDSSKILNYKCDINFFCDVEENKNFSYYLNYFSEKKFDFLKKKDFSLSFTIGCEAGFSDDEKNFFLLNNFLPLSLGNNILRVETAAISAVSCGNIWKDFLIFFRKNLLLLKKD